MWEKQINSAINQIFEQMDGDSYTQEAVVKIGKEIYPVILYWSNRDGYMVHIARISPDYEQVLHMTFRQIDMIVAINEYMDENVNFVF